MREICAAKNREQELDQRLRADEQLTPAERAEYECGVELQNKVKLLHSTMECMIADNKLTVGERDACVRNQRKRIQSLELELLGVPPGPRFERMQRGIGTMRDRLVRLEAVNPMDNLIDVGMAKQWFVDAAL